MIQYFSFKFCQGLFFWALFFPRTKFFRALFFGLAFSKTKDLFFQTIRSDPRLSGKFILVYIAQTGSYQKSSCSSPMARVETVV